MLEDFIAGNPASLAALVRKLPEEYATLSDSHLFSIAADGNLDIEIYVKKLLVDITLYAGLSKEDTCNQGVILTKSKVNLLLRVLKKKDAMRKFYYTSKERSKLGYNPEKRLEELEDVGQQIKICKSIGCFPRTTKAVVSNTERTREEMLGEDLVKMVDAGRRYSREEFKVLIQAWIDKHDLSKKYKSLNVDNIRLLVMVNRFLASIGKCWECIQSRNQGERDRFYTLTNLM